MSEVTSPPRRVAVVSGASSPVGIGARVAHRLVADGWNVLVLDVDERVHETASGLRSLDPDAQVLASVVDTSVETAVDEAFARAQEELGRLDLLVHSAGVAGDEVDLVDLDSREFDRIVAINLRGTFLTTRAAARLMKPAGSGAIVTISSIFGLEPIAKTAAYSATKAGVIAMTQALARELGPYGVRVNSIAPGYINTEMLIGKQRERAERAGRTLAQEQTRIDETVPLRRHGTGDDIAGVVIFLASEDADYITGWTLGVNGGIVTR